MFSLVEVEEGALETISLPIFAYSESTSTYQYREVSYAIARKGDPNVSIDFDNNNATLLYNSSTGKYVNAPVTNVAVFVGGEDISSKAIVHITTVNLIGTVKRGLKSSSFGEGGIDDNIDGEGVIGIEVTGLISGASVGSVIAYYTDSDNNSHTATFNVTRSVGRYAVEIITTPTQISYNQTTGLASSSKVVATINAVDINGVRTENAIFADYGAIKYRNLGETTWTEPSDQKVSQLEITPDFTKRGIEFLFIDGSGNQLDYETVPIASVTNGGDAYLVNAASMNVAVTLSSISYGTSTGYVTNVVYMTKNNAVLSSGVEYNVPVVYVV